MTHISILLVHYNSELETRECLLSLKKVVSKNFQFSVVVVDNGSKESLQVEANEMPEGAVILRSDANLGFSEGNNLAYKYALEHFQTDYILLLNNDTTVEPQFLAQLLEAAEKTEKVGMVTPKIYFSAGREFHTQSYTPEERGKIFWYAGGSIDWSNLDAFHRGVDELDRGQFDSQTESDFATGCCVLIPRSVLDTLGLLENKYFLYLEDVDLSMKIRQAGYKVMFCPAAVVWHKNAGSTGGSGSALQQYYQTRNRLYFFTKFGSWRIWFTVFKYQVKLLLWGTPIQKRAVTDWLLGKMGKQAVL
jgi:GT2 family glycosyltransferase